MTRYLGLFVALLVGLTLGMAGYGYFHGRGSQEHGAEVKKPLYYRHPMNPKVTSPSPAKDEMGMDYLPVYGEDLASPTEPGKKGRVLYYRHPMGAADTSPVPKKDEMGMDYLPVYDGEVINSRQVNISPERIQKLGVRTEALTKRKLVRSVRALGSIAVDERRVQTVSARFEGWVQRLNVNATGQPVKKGQVLLEIYSPDLLTAQQEYVIAKKGVNALQEASSEARATAAQLMSGALRRLKYWNIAADDLRRLESRGTPSDVLPLRSPVSGTVLDKPAIQGMRFMPGETLFRIASLDEVWLLADIFEQDMEGIRLGQDIQVHINAYPDRPFRGRVSFIEPTLSTETRTVKIRIEMPNREGLLRPGLYGSVNLTTTDSTDARLAIPDSAVLDSGTRKLILVQKSEGVFEPREVILGRYADGYFEVLDGVSADERVVTRANFLIDAESKLKSALDEIEGPAAPPVTPSHPHEHGGH